MLRDDLSGLRLPPAAELLAVAKTHLGADARVTFVHGDASPQPNWPPGHDTKVAGLLARLEADPYLRITKLTWASGIVIAVKVAR